MSGYRSSLMRANAGENDQSPVLFTVSGSGRLMMVGAMPADTLTLVNLMPLASLSLRHRFYKMFVPPRERVILGRCECKRILDGPLVGDIAPEFIEMPP